MWAGDRGKTQMRNYNINGISLYTRRLPVNARDFVSWANVWLFVQVLIAMVAVDMAWGYPIFFWVVAVALTWLISAVNKI